MTRTKAALYCEPSEPAQEKFRTGYAGCRLLIDRDKQSA